MKNHAPIAMVEYEILDSKDKGRIKLPSYLANLKWKVKNKANQILKQGEVPFKSYVGNFAEVLNYAFFNINNSTNLRRTSGVAASNNVHSLSVLETAKVSPAPSTYGIWIGNRTGNPGVDLTGVLTGSGIGGDINFADYDLSVRMRADGDPASAVDTNIVYGTTSISMSSNELSVSRSFSNNRITPIRISEVGLVGKSASSEYFLIARDKINDGVNTWIEVEDGQVIEIDYVFTVDLASGFTKNFLRMLSSEWNGGNSVENLQDVNGSSVTVNFTSGRTQKDILAALANDNFGILVGGNVGSGSLITYALDENAYKLQRKIANTYFTHGAIVPLNSSSADLSDGYSIIGCQRDFTNVSSIATITVYEAGLFIKETANSRYFMLNRVLTPGAGGVNYLTIPPGKILRLKYYLAFPLEDTLIESI